MQITVIHKYKRNTSTGTAEIISQTGYPREFLLQSLSHYIKTLLVPGKTSRS